MNKKISIFRIFRKLGYIIELIGILTDFSDEVIHFSKKIQGNTLLKLKAERVAKLTRDILK